jgi:hypothetical protein
MRPTTYMLNKVSMCEERPTDTMESEAASGDGVLADDKQRNVHEYRDMVFPVSGVDGGVKGCISGGE